MKRIRHSINTLVWVLVGLYLGGTILINIPAVQRHVGAEVASVLSRKLNTKVWVGRVDLGLLNRIIIDDMKLLDQKGKSLLQATRISAKFDYIALIQGRISITSAQLFGMKANLYKETADSKPNFQFVLDSLASKDTTQHKPLNLELKSLIIRHGEVAYNQWDAPIKSSFDSRHIRITNLSSHLILNTLRDDSLHLNVKRLALTERSGANIKSLTFKLVANTTKVELNNFELVLPSSRLSLGNITATYRVLNKAVDIHSIHYKGSVEESYINPYDIACLEPKLKKFCRSVSFSSSFSGTGTELYLHRFKASMPQMGKNATLSSPADIHLSVSGNVKSLDHTPHWTANISDLMINEAGLEMLAGDIPDAVGRLHNIRYHGVASGYGNNIQTKGVLKSGAGDAKVTLSMHQDNFAGHLDTEGFNLKQVLNNDKFGILAANIHVDGNIKHKYYKAKGAVQRIDYNRYAYHNVLIDGTFNDGLLVGKFDIDDPNLVADLQGSLSISKKNMSANITGNVRHFHPSAVRLLEDKLGNAVYGGSITASFTGNTLNTAKGNLNITNFSKQTPDGEYRLDSLRLHAGNKGQGHFITLRSDFAEADISGRFDYSTLIQSIKNAIVRKLPSIQQLTPIKYRRTQSNDFSLRASINRSDWIQEFFNVPVQLLEPVSISASLSKDAENIETNIFAPDVIYDNGHYKNISIIATSPNNKLNADISVTKMDKKGIGMEYRLEASANNDQLMSVLFIDNHAAKQRLSARLNTILEFERTANGLAEAHVNIGESQISIGDSTFTIHPSNIIYSKNNLKVNNFLITSGYQHININGITTKDSNDSLVVDLQDVNVGYILNLVNFDAVDFSGRASGRAHLSQLFGKPDVHGRLEISDFCFQEGRMGTLYADVKWNKGLEEIDIDAQAVDTMNVKGGFTQQRVTTVNGYVSPKRNYIDLGINANNTRAEFIKSFCSSFMNRADVTANGDVRLWGDLGDINLTGLLVANGTIAITPLNTVYTLRNDTIRCLVNEIQFENDTIFDRNGNVGVVSGSLYHDHLSRLTYDLNVYAHNLLGYDWGPTYGSTFYGTVYGTGGVNIKGKSGEVNIDVNLTPERGSQVVYDVSSPDAIGEREFIRWTSRNVLPDDTATLHAAHTRPDDISMPQDFRDIPTDIHINFLINATPDATLKLLMDKSTGDYIDLNGSGGIRASYYNKGGLDIFGNYLIDHGVYKLTIQNIIKKDFIFTPGGSIVFGGDPYAATLNLKAQYTVNSVSLSDLQIGRSFSGNNIRVNCLMNITGTPAAPKVEFDLDMPTVGTDAKQMIYSLINSEEEMNQQVLYLLAIGRFYSQGNNNSATGTAADNRTSLAMQSLLSGQISQQLNNVLSSVLKNNNWNIGANISTGDEGWNNAEYEGLLSGRLLNNRLLFNGQFGYRDNNNATTVFIGDFDLRYLIFPNGNLSVHVYNQTNDRYFTRNSLNTQGIGVIVKKDFDSWRSLFRWKKKKKANTVRSKKKEVAAPPEDKP